MLKFLYNLKTRTYLLFVLLLSVVPFLNYRVLRMAGDEKVYVSQAIEMARQGNWFVQTLANEPNYFKGPLHYILVRIGMLLFGNSLIAGVWMNAAFMVATAFALYKLGKKYLNEERALLLSLASALNVGIFSHALASQMEVEISAFYAFALAALGLADQKKPEGFFNQLRNDLPFWIVVGIAGWVKSPAHCVLMAAGGIFYWMVSGQLASKLSSPGAWFAVIAGVATCAAGYAPVLLSDYSNFYQTYILRENIEKANNNREWHYVIIPLLHFVLPWFFICLLGLFNAFKMRLQTHRLAVLGFSFALPTLIFWATFTYKGQNYNLPALSALVLACVACLPTYFSRLPFRVMGIIGLIASFTALFLVMHFLPLPGWWKPLPLLAAFLFIFSFSVIFLFAHEMRALGVGAVFFFLAFGTFIIPLGEREIRDIRSFVEENPSAVFFYDDIDTSIWSEWGLMQLAIHKPIQGIHKQDALLDALKPGHAILLNSEAALDRVENAWNTLHGEHATTTETTSNELSSGEDTSAPRIILWNRWLTKGKTADGTPMWKLAWDARDLSKLERPFYIYFIPPMASH